MAETTTTSSPDEPKDPSAPCPNCGYCPHCKRATPVPMLPYIGYPPNWPYRYDTGYRYGTISTNITGTDFKVTLS